MTPIIGLDPGLSGGIAMLEKGSPPLLTKMPDTERDLFGFLCELQTAANEPPVAYIESVHAMPAQGVSSTFKFGVNYGQLRMALVAVGIPFTAVSPPVWQKAMGCSTKGNKNVSKSRAQELFPRSKILHATADALLIASYGWHRHYGKHYPAT